MWKMHISTYLFGGHFEGRRAHFNYIWNNCWLWVTDLYVSIYDPTCQATDENHWYGWLCATSYLLMSAIVSIFGAHFCRWWDPSVFRKVVNARTTHRLISWQHNIHSIDRIYQTTSQECKSRPETTKKPSVDRFLVQLDTLMSFLCKPIPFLQERYNFQFSLVQSASIKYFII